MVLARSVLLLSTLLSLSSAWYIPGVSPVSYRFNQPVVIKVNSLTSTQGVMPYPFYSFKQCTPPKDRLKREKKVENLGEVLWGDQIEPSLFRAEMLHNVTCRKLCDGVTYTEKEMSKLLRRIELQYRGNLVLDNLPVAQQIDAGPRHPKLLTGYPLGTPRRFAPGRKTALVNNHLHLRIDYHIPVKADPNDEDVYRIVGFYVTAHSVRHTDTSCDATKPFAPEELPHQTVDDKNNIVWSYSVSWTEDPNTVWATRWDVYLRGGEADAKVHWYSITNSLLIVLFLGGMVAMIMLRTLHKDFNRYNNPENIEEAQEETGWKLVHGDVFRTPDHPVLLAAIIGTGSQLAGMTVITLIFACAGFLSPSNRGGLLTSVILLFVLLGIYAGYVSARLCKFFKRQAWRNSFLAGMLVPGSMFVIYLTLNMVQWTKEASSAIPFTTLLLLISLWFCVSLPLVLVGAAIGYKVPVLEVPCRVNPLPRLVPAQKWTLQAPTVILGSGILPFGAAFIEVVYIMSSFWQGRVYYVFGFLAVVFIILVITCAEIAIVMIYFQLCYENYHWWWRSFFLTASSGLYFFLYSLYYLGHSLNIRQWSSMILYMGYMLMTSSLFGLFTGTVGFIAAFAFVQKIYRSIKID